MLKVFTCDFKDLVTAFETYSELKTGFQGIETKPTYQTHISKNGVKLYSKNQFLIHRKRSKLYVTRNLITFTLINASINSVAYG